MSLFGASADSDSASDGNGRWRARIGRLGCTRVSTGPENAMRVNVDDPRASHERVWMRARVQRPTDDARLRRCVHCEFATLFARSARHCWQPDGYRFGDCSYTFRLFAARQDTEIRVTRYTLACATTASATLQTTGPNAGAAGATTNDDTIVEFTGIKPDAWGHVFLDVAIETGLYAYLSRIEHVVEP